MDQNNGYQSDFSNFSPAPKQPPHKREEWRCPVGLLMSLLCFAVVATMLFTYTVTASWVKRKDAELLMQQQQTIDALRQTLESGSDFDQLEFVATLFDQFSYYSNKFDQQAIIAEVLKTYAAATGDHYADYYTAEEYAAILEDNQGSGVGIGISIVQTPLEVNGYQYQTFHVISIYKNAPAEDSDLRLGDYIYALKVDGAYKTLEQLGGYTVALKAFGGEAGSAVEFMVLRPSAGEGYTQHEIRVTRGAFQKESVRYTVAENVPEVGIVQIAEFDIGTPNQFKAAVTALQKAGVKHFIFDVRNNPGGDLQSIKAIATYFLQEGDLILQSINQKGSVAASYYAEATEHNDPRYEPCNVARDEVGMFADLDMVVLCNNNTASAAEVFTATLRDHKNVTIVGETTYGKGIMQQYFDLAKITYGMYEGCVKMTTHAYVTECGETYHEIGIAPTQGYEVTLSDEALQYNFFVLPQALDNQLQKALTAFQN